jgi:hypothetical protein
MKRFTAPVTPVAKLWPGDTVVCLASGPSLTKGDVDLVRGKAKVIAINASYALAPWADALYCADVHPFKWYWNSGPKGFERVSMREFAGLKFSVSPEAGKWSGVSIVGRGREDSLSLDPKRVCLGRNSGYQAINLAVLLGAVRVVLLGYDMQVATDGRKHFFGDHPDKRRSPYPTFRQSFNSLVKPLKAAGVDVVNCSRHTSVTAFRRQSLNEVFPVSAEVAA